MILMVIPYKININKLLVPENPIESDIRYVAYYLRACKKKNI